MIGRGPKEAGVHVCPPHSPWALDQALKPSSCMGLCGGKQRDFLRPLPPSTFAELKTEMLSWATGTQGPFLAKGICVTPEGCILLAVQCAFITSVHEHFQSRQDVLTS